VIWPVWIDDWQFESGGEPFAVGNTVEWTLLLEDGSNQGVPPGRLVTASLHISLREVIDPARDWVAPAQEEMAVEAGGMHAWYRAPAYGAPAATSAVFEFTGLLSEDHHGASSDVSRGVVRGIEIVTRRFRYVDGHQQLQDADGWTTQTVDQTPPHLKSEMEPVGPEIRPGWRGARPVWQQDLLAQVEYADEPDGS
jgi:hypothetical protein